MGLANWNIEAMTGYHPLTTFYTDFSIADGFNVEAIKDTYKRTFKEYKGQYKYLTELVMVLNWKCWEHYDKGNSQYSQLYQDLYEKTDEYALDHLKDEELSYYFRTTD